MNPLTPTDDDPRPHLQCEAGRPPSPADLLWRLACERLTEVLTADERQAA